MHLVFFHIQKSVWHKNNILLVNNEIRKYAKENNMNEYEKIIEDLRTYTNQGELYKYLNKIADKLEEYTWIPTTKVFQVYWTWRTICHGMAPKPRKICVICVNSRKELQVAALFLLSVSTKYILTFIS